MNFLARIVVNAIAIWVTTLLLGSNFVVHGGNSLLGTIAVYLAVALIFAIANAIVKPILKFFTFIFYVLTLGLFGLVVNALVLLAVDAVTSGRSWGLQIGGFWWAVLAGLIVAIVNAVLMGLFDIGNKSGSGLARR
ncbi:phage holin family protein [Rarobacter incanus]|uniref:Putative membrane protein n=1 Tax=Rarobacter incanus TaxID=153494 RepID=A0A542SRC8_9MICO|nr:phage holin family protein [Rarobacter incanus]TQK76767.1 putative membrane protein [Rarobacter incanus]